MIELTGMAFGYSRDDAERNFLIKYVEEGILPKNPFQTLDRDGVGRLMQMAVTDGRQSRINLEVGICGEHGGDPASVEYTEMHWPRGLSMLRATKPTWRLSGAKNTSL